MLTYNHEQFIAQAIESALAQITSFDFEIVIADDCSTDKTQAILRRFKEKHPFRIRMQCAPQNVGMVRNFAAAISRCRGEYIALLEGDDFWTFTRKLQMQADYLDSHRKCALSYHRVSVLGGSATETCFPTTNRWSITTEDLLRDNVIPTCSVVFRRSALPELPSWMTSLSVLDWPLFALLTDSGTADFVPQTMGVYRIHPHGIWSRASRTRRYQSRIEVLKALKKHLGARYAETIRRSLYEQYALLAWSNEEENRLREALLASWQALALAPSDCLKSVINVSRLFLKYSVLSRQSSLPAMANTSPETR